MRAQPDGLHDIRDIGPMAGDLTGGRPQAGLATRYNRGMSDEYQIPIPPSFHAVHADLRGRLQLPLRDFRARYELCEDLSQSLVEPAQALRFDLGVTEADVLQRMARGLQLPASGLAPAEAGWVLRRLAELLDWPWTPLPEAASDGA